MIFPHCCIIPVCHPFLTPVTNRITMTLFKINTSICSIKGAKLKRLHQRCLVPVLGQQPCSEQQPVGRGQGTESQQHGQELLPHCLLCGRQGRNLNWQTVKHTLQHFRSTGLGLFFVFLNVYFKYKWKYIQYLNITPPYMLYYCTH